MLLQYSQLMNDPAYLQRSFFNNENALSDDAEVGWINRT